MQKISLVIVEDHIMVRQMYRGIFGDKQFYATFNFEIDIIGECGTVEDAIETIRLKNPDIVFLDVDLGNDSGLDLIPKIRKYSPRSIIIGVSMFSQPAYAQKMIQMGAKGYVTKSSSLEELLNSISEVMKGNVYLCSEIRESMLKKKLYDESARKVILNKLTIRELEIIKLIKEGFSSKDIAESIFIDVRTVEAHRYKILKKLNINTKSSLINVVKTTEFDFI